MTFDQSFMPLAAFAPVLIATAIFDLRQLRIPNDLVVIGLVIFASSALFLPLPEIGFRVLGAIICFAVLFTGYCLRLLGGGDVKMLSVLVLFIPVTELTQFAYLFSFSLLAGAGLTIVLQNLPRANNSTLKSRRAKGYFPMGVSIALSGLLTLAFGVL